MKVSRRVYVLSGRIMSPFALLGLKVYTLITKRPRVRVVAINEHDEILLIRGVISHLGWWTLPGGGVNKHEALDAAAKRELYEETGVRKPLDEFRFLRTIERPELGLNFEAPLFYVPIKHNDLPKTLHNPAEIADIGWFAIDALPELTAKLVHAAIAEYRVAKQRWKL
jgi:ADP-ribose pyrophosphatase YjhB (NUDIX family)